MEWLALSPGIQLALPITSLDSQEMDDWVATNSPLISTMEKKIGKMTTLKNQEQRSKLRDAMIRHFLVGQNALGRLKRTYPDLYEEVIRFKGEKERFLEVECLLSTDPPNETVTKTIKEFASALEGQLPYVSGQTAKAFAFEAASDWLLRCPLDFPERA